MSFCSKPKFGDVFIMLYVKFRFSNIIFGLTALAISASPQAGVSVIVSAPPPVREIVVGPPGYTTCYVVPAGFFNGVWFHKHRVCEYEGSAGLRIWVNGFWQCGSFRSGGICTGWHWIGSHWANRHDMEFYRREALGNNHRHYAGRQINEHDFRRGNEYGHGYEHRHGHR
jgi:hypothetical protein